MIPSGIERQANATRGRHNARTAQATNGRKKAVSMSVMAETREAMLRLPCVPRLSKLPPKR